jgi:hypothetical protein
VRSPRQRPPQRLAAHETVQQPFQHVAPIALPHRAPIETVAALAADAASVRGYTLLDLIARYRWRNVEASLG